MNAAASDKKYFGATYARWNSGMLKMACMTALR